MVSYLMVSVFRLGAFINLGSTEIDEAIAAVDLVRHENAIKRAAMEKEMR